MSDLMTKGVILMPFDLAMSSDISRMQFYTRAQSLLAERDAYRELCVDMLEELKSASAYMSQGLMPSRKDVNSAITRAEKLLGEEK